MKTLYSHWKKKLKKKTNKNFRNNLILLCSSIFISFLIAEVLTRVSGQYYERADRFNFRSTTLLPYKLPIKWTEEVVQRYGNLDKRYAEYVYDPYLGWTDREHSISTFDSIYIHTIAGIRAASIDTPIATESGKIRIALFGDSFTAGGDVKFEDTWGYFLEQNLKQQGFDAEVLNFGMGGGAMDQAYLRWKYIGNKFKPDVVIFGFQNVDMRSNVNIIRAVQNEDLPFSKPRFILQGDQLKLINYPALTPKQVIEIMKNINNWSLLPYEEHYQADYYKYNDLFLFKSRFISLIYTALKLNAIQSKYAVVDKNLTTEEDRLAYAITNQFRTDVEASGEAFYVLDIPLGGDVEFLSKDNPLSYQSTIDKIASVAKVIEPRDRLAIEVIKHPENPRYLDVAAHYNSIGNKIIADTITDTLSKDLRDRYSLLHK